jgi:hypothetical protein
VRSAKKAFRSPGLTGQLTQRIAGNFDFAAIYDDLEAP